MPKDPNLVLSKGEEGRIPIRVLTWKFLCSEVCGLQQYAQLHELFVERFLDQHSCGHSAARSAPSGCTFHIGKAAGCWFCKVQKNATSFLTSVQWCRYSHPQANPSQKPATHDNPLYSHVILASRDSVSPLKPPLSMSAEDNVRVLFSGDVEGKLQQLFKRVQSVSFASLEHWTSVAWLCWISW